MTPASCSPSPRSACRPPPAPTIPPPLLPSRPVAPARWSSIRRSRQACVDYGFVPGTVAYNRCVEREARRPRARPRGAWPTPRRSLAADARDGLLVLWPGAGQRDLRPLRRPRDGCPPLSPGADQTPIVGAGARDHDLLPASPGTTVYRPRRSRRPRCRPPPPAGVQAFRDEYGFRYDGQGNRLDARGNIISPQSTRP